jgi:hypothetical protein
MTRRCYGMLIVLFPFVVGCTSGADRLVKVTGTATHNGKPVPNVAVHFMPENGLRSVALTDNEGKFTLVHSDGREGALVGTHKVWVELPTGGTKDADQQKRLAMQRNDPSIVQVLQKYGNADITPMRLEITESQEVELKLD